MLNFAAEVEKILSLGNKEESLRENLITLSN